MGIISWIFYIVMGIICFFFLFFLEKKYQISRRDQFVFSILFLMIISGLCYRYGFAFTNDIFLIFVFLFVFDVIFTSYFLDVDFFNREDKKISYYLFLIAVGFVINQEFINKVNQVFLTGEDYRLLLWTGGFVFLYHFVDRKKIMKYSTRDTIHLSSEYVLEQYAKLKYKYYDVCEWKNHELSNLLYAIMIYQNHKRSSFLRKYDYFMFRLNGDSRPLGIMQVNSNSYISDIESIEITKKNLEKYCYKNKKAKAMKEISEILEEYSSDASSIQSIYDIIKKF